MKKFGIHIFSFFLLFYLGGSSILYAMPQSMEKPILLVSSYNPDSYRIMKTINDFMDKYRDSGGQSEILIENMNSKSFFGANTWKSKLRKILTYYTKNRKPEVVILLGQEAWAAYLSLKDEVKSDIPVIPVMVSSNVFLLDNIPDSLNLWMPKSIILDKKSRIHNLRDGIFYKYDLRGNIRMILSLFPKTRHIAFISDNTYGGVNMQALFCKEMLRFPQLNSILLDGRVNSIYEVNDRLGKLPEHTVILLGSWLIDKNKGYFMRNAFYSMMAVNPHIPAFTSSSMGLGYWTIGGVIPDYLEQGRLLAEKVLNIEKHPKDTISHVTVIKSYACCEIGQMKKWKLNVDQIPFKVKVVNLEPTFYQKYKLQIFVIICFFVILLIALFISLYFYYKMKIAKNKLQVSEYNLIVAKDKAEESDRLKSTFLANMSHDIRTPLNSIVGFTDLISSQQLPKEEEAEYFQIIKLNSDLLLRLVNDILDLSRLEANQMPFTFKDCDVVVLCKNTVASVSVSPETTNKVLFTSAFDQFILKTDAQRLQEVLVNLLTNSNKFTTNGVITLNFSLDEHKNESVFTVSDTGCGIPLKNQKDVFNRFEKLSETSSGSGLGLSICLLIVKKWGGRIWVDPNYTDGTRFIFTHPLVLENQ